MINDVSLAVYSILAQQQAVEHYGTELRGEKTGSGIVFMVKGGSEYLITNFHVVENAERINVIDSEKNTIQAELVGSDPLEDIAVLQIKARQPVEAPVFFNKLVKPSTFVIALSSPFEFDRSATFGIVSANQRTLTTNPG